MRKSERGAAMVEFAIVFPLQLFVVLGMIQLALAFGASQVVLYSSYSAARSAIADRSEEEAYRSMQPEVAADLAAEKAAEIATLALTWAPVSRAETREAFLSEISSQALTQYARVQPLTDSTEILTGDVWTSRVQHHYTMLITGVGAWMVGEEGFNFVPNDDELEDIPRAVSSMSGG